MSHPENNVDVSLKMMVVLSKAYHSIEKTLVQDMKNHGLNPNAFAVLELLYHKGSQPIQHIGKRILMTSGSMTYVIDKLEKQDLLTRERCPNDRRVIYAVITQEGKALMDHIFPKHAARIQELFSVLSDEEKEQLIPMLKKLGIAAEDYSA
ncbi:MarR family transcriptional regulator, 2-MHQ and catechol-resistance regulon repressor [Salibacterium qingdaonense]|uniref:MarR family transcriptional regulator, 2-MHQ and catechol-resistance regulon repressor n=2 Tax=Salibacterium qingdaonense TaxID=266892 RepID=A0A1I4K461_9BACI|nr:MarR family transcriptional regulator, 2-MHQ and catechol-resistance regulon repressor [Salibacterium qingdaonense]